MSHGLPPRIGPRLPIRPAALLALSLAAGCLDAAPGETTEVTIAEAVAFESIGWGQRARLDTTEIAVRDADAWIAYQDSLHPLQPFTKVNFDQEMVLLVAVPVATGGYSVQIEVVEQTGEGLTVRYLLSTPADDCRTTMGEAVVFQAVRLARLDDPLHFVREQEAYRCTEPG